MSSTLIASISGIRGIFGSGLDAETVVRYAAAFGTWVRQEAGDNPTVVVGMDGRVTGEICRRLTIAALQSTGCNVIDTGMATTPTVEMAVMQKNADGGIILSASHNPAEWNALKLLNGRGEFLSAEQGQAVLDIAHNGHSQYVRYDKLGTLVERDFLDDHIDEILKLSFVDVDKIRARKFKVVVDGINSIGGVAVPRLLERLGIAGASVVCLHCEPTGHFAHEAEPLPANLTELMELVRTHDADLGIAVDPDADRLAFVADGGAYIGEEMTQVLAADFLWSLRGGPFVTNLSSSRTIDDVAERHGQQVFRSAVGEVNVVEKMREVGAILGGEGNGGIILPDLHYGRDALVGIVMVLQHMTNLGEPLSAVVERMPKYVIAKHKTSIEGKDADGLLGRLKERYAAEGADVDTTDGLKISMDTSWVHLRKSNTEPIIRIYAEAPTSDEAHALAERFKEEL